MFLSHLYVSEQPPCIRRLQAWGGPIAAAAARASGATTRTARTAPRRGLRAWATAAAGAWAERGPASASCRRPGPGSSSRTTRWGAGGIGWVSTLYACSGRNREGTPCVVVLGQHTWCAAEGLAVASALRTVRDEWIPRPQVRECLEVVRDVLSHSSNSGSSNGRGAGGAGGAAGGGGGGGGGDDGSGGQPPLLLAALLCGGLPYVLRLLLQNDSLADMAARQGLYGAVLALVRCGPAACASAPRRKHPLLARRQRSNCAYAAPP